MNSQSLIWLNQIRGGTLDFHRKANFTFVPLAEIILGFLLQTFSAEGSVTVALSVCVYNGQHD